MQKFCKLYINIAMLLQLVFKK